MFDVRSGRFGVGNGAANDSFVDLAQRFEIDPELLRDARAVVIHHDVGMFDQAVKDFFSFGCLQIESQALLAAVVSPELRLLAAKIPATKRIAARGLFYLYD